MNFQNIEQTSCFNIHCENLNLMFKGLILDVGFRFNGKARSREAAKRLVRFDARKSWFWVPSLRKDLSQQSCSLSSHEDQALKSRANSVVSLIFYCGWEKSQGEAQKNCKFKLIFLRFAIFSIVELRDLAIIILIQLLRMAESTPPMINICAQRIRLVDPRIHSLVSNNW